MSLKEIFERRDIQFFMIAIALALTVYGIDKLLNYLVGGILS